MFSRALWLALNRLNNARPASDVDPSLEIVRFSASSVMSFWPKIDVTASPARKLCDLFWLSLPWPRIATELGGSVRVIEVGCGSGKYGLLLKNALGEAFGGYVGLDVEVHDEWAALQSDSITLIQADVSTIEEHLAERNMIITQSALEHFDEDLVLFRKIEKHVQTTIGPLIQVHLMPSAGCLTTFLWHGVRHYTPRTVSRLTRIFGTRTLKRLYFLGSANANRIHRRYITYPGLFGKGDRRQTRQALYDQELQEAVLRDEIAPKKYEACFHALVLQSRVAHDIFTSRS